MNEQKNTHGRSFLKTHLKFRTSSQKKEESSNFCLSILSRKRKEKSILKPKQFHGKIKKILFCRENRIASHFSGFEEATEPRLERNRCSDLDLIFICYFFVNEILCVESSFWIAFEFFEVRGVFQGD